MDGLTRVDYPDGSYVSYRYDKSNRLTKVSTAFGDTAYQYDTLDRITRVIDRNGYATVYEYDANGNRTAVKYANGLTVSYEYDKLNRLICEETVDSDSNLVVKYVYTLGASGERVKVEELDRTVEYTYDELYRLTSETITKGKKVTTYTYAYDNVSNRTLKTVNGVETVYTYNSLNQLISENDTAYEYDLNGNLVRVIGTGKTALYEYNSENKLIKATVQQGNNVVVESYTYDYAGSRTSKTTSTNNHVEKVYYLNDNSSLTNVLAEIGADSTEKCFYTIGADILSQEIDGKVYVYLYDGHGTVRALANENGKITDTYCYDAFGNLISSTGSTANSYRYCGEQFDSTTGLYYLRARYMDTSTGRFISQDSYAGSTADPISLHRYLYANSNPVMYSDPSGYMSLGELGVSGAISSILDTINSNFAMAIWSSFISGFIAVGDQISAGNFNPKELLSAFEKGFVLGFAFSLVSMFLPIKIMMALSGVGVILGFVGAVDSFANGEFWQGIYRASLSTLGGIGWWRSFGGELSDWIASLNNNNDNHLLFGDEWYAYFKGKYGSNNVQWKPNSAQDILDNPVKLKGLSADEVSEILGSGWIRGTYGSNGLGWKFTKGDVSIFYHAGGGIHGGSYYGIASGSTGKIKVVNPTTYVPTKDDNAEIIFDE